jgi:subtilisin family serine protease
LESRIRYLWNQAGTASTKSFAAGWAPPADFGFGLELKKADIDRALAQPGSVMTGGAVNVDQVHEILDFVAPELASHGTHVMGIAAGNGRSLMGSRGIASAADIIFVQLPQTAITGGGAVLYDNILDGVMYIFARARQLNLPAVVNISYGGYTGPHDGTTELEAGIDQLLAMSERSVVVAAGNGFEADCHANGTIRPGQSSAPLNWVIRPEDPTSNYVEIWYNGDTNLELRLTPPDGGSTLGPVALHARFDIKRSSDQQIIGAIDHTRSPGNNDQKIAIILSPTAENAAPGPQAGIMLPPSATAPSGVWTIDLKNTGSKRAEFHAWIERDASGGRGSSRRQQSHFLAADADPSCTLGGLATGVHTIAVGAYNSATQEICRYSACGPTRAMGADRNTVREKPEICAPAESDPPGRGTLCASSLRAQPTRMNGTSASAPHVAGLVAVMYQYIRDVGRPALTADEMRDKIMQAALTSAPLRYNRHQQANDARPHKQQDMRLKDLTGSGKLDVKETLNRL